MTAPLTRHQEMVDHMRRHTEARRLADQEHHPQPVTDRTVDDEKVAGAVGR
jgi:hypothetical protein